MTNKSKEKNSSVLVIDLQGDFTSFYNGTLAVPGTDKSYLDKVNKAVLQLEKKSFTIYASQDWHPKDHISFAVNHGKLSFEQTLIEGKKETLWPVHCVQETPGTELKLDN